MVTKLHGRSRLVLAAAAACVTAGCASERRAARDQPADDAMAEISERLADADDGGRRNLQQRLMGFVDRAMSRMEEATDAIVFATTNPTVRSAAHETKYYTLLAMVSLAADVKPEVSLIDLMVMTRLERTKWAENWCDQFMGEQSAETLRGAQADIERDIWSIGAEYLSQHELDKLTTIIDAWRRDHPDRKYLTRVRLDTIAQMRGESEFTKKVSGGLFAPVSEAAQAAEEIKLLGERGIYLAERMPLLIAWQAEVLVYDLARTPEADQLLANARALTAAVERGSQALERLETRHGGYERLIADLRGVLDHANDTSARVRQTVEAANELAGTATKLLEDVDATLDALSATADRFLPASDPDAEPGRGLHPAQDTIRTLAAAVQELNELVRRTDGLLASSAWNQRLTEMNDAARANVTHARQAGTDLVNHAFRRALILIAATGATVIAVAAALRMLPGRRPTSPAE